MKLHLVICMCLLDSLWAYTNVALNKPAKQSSLYPHHGRPEAVVDGNLGTNINVCTATNESSNSWWRVDLQKNYEVASVVITNRGDCCGDRLKNFNVLVTDTEPIDPSETAEGTLCKHQDGPVAQGATVTLTCDQKIVGRYVTLVLMEKNYLNFCELQVMAVEASTPPSDPCASEPCLNGGTCSKDGDGSTGSYHCTCAAGFEGDMCEREQKTENKPCSDVSECTVPNTDCFKGMCLCSPGYFFSVSTKTCVESCDADKLQSTFTRYPEAKIKRNRLYAKVEVSVPECQVMCAEDPKCVAFTRREKGKKPKCMFHEKTAKDVGDSWRTGKDGYDFYQQNCA